ncbi:MAG: acetoin utilization protein AcuC [Bowdeniella nasicola]|nr:acetoin utilization protein AcuC [Bowdeniella nasicola]
MEAAPRVDLIWSPEFVEYDFAPGHPMDPARLSLTHALVEAMGLTAAPHVRVRPAPLATDDELRVVHTEEYVAAVRAASSGAAPEGAARFGIGDADCPAFVGMHTASARLTGGTLAACRAVASGEARRAVNFAGGMHHAMPAKAAGFCVYNDAAVAAADLLARGVEPICIIDIDAHHGDGVERMFRDEPRVTTISLHQHPDTLFPHTGYPQDSGGTGARGHAINLCLPPESGDGDALRALEAVVEPVLMELQPALVITQHGCDGHQRDPLTNLGWSIEGMRAAAQLLRDLISTHAAEGRWVALGGGGYAICDVVPRAWAHLVAVVAEQDLDPQGAVPRDWRELAASLASCAKGGVPEVMGDGSDVTFTPFSHGYDPANPIDRAIMATRSAAFPDLGIDPMTV